MKLSCRLYIYVGYYSKFALSKRVYLSSEMRVIDKVMKKQKIMANVKGVTILTLESFEFSH